jgi:phage I-like protein
MNTIEAIEKREDVSPEEGKGKYGDVDFADQKNKKYPIDTEAHIRAAWNYINQSDNAAKYSAEDVKSIKGKIVAAWKRKIDKDGPPSADEKNSDKAESSLVVSAAATTTFDGQAPEKIVYMPKGEWTISPRVNGEPKEVTVTVDQQTAATLQSDFEKRLAAPVRPIGHFDHKPGKASFIPKSFSWDESKGVILDVDWTRAGKDAIEGRDYSYFSPTFLLSDNKVIGLTEKGEVGSLTNSPAFEQIERIAASSDPDDDDDPDDKGTMTKVATKLVDFQLITAEQCNSEDAVVTAVVTLHAELEAVQASNAALLQENTNLKLEAERIKGQEADTVIQAAIAEGKIGSQDKDSIGFFRAQLIAAPATTKKVLASMPVNPVLKQVIQVSAGDSRAAVTDGRTKARMMADMHNAVAEIQAANPDMSYSDAWNKAKREHKELFIEA